MFHYYLDGEYLSGDLVIVMNYCRTYTLCVPCSIEISIIHFYNFYTILFICRDAFVVCMFVTEAFIAGLENHHKMTILIWCLEK